MTPFFSKFCTPEGLAISFQPPRRDDRSRITGGTRRMLRMLDRHAIQELLRADVPVRQIARQFAISRWTVRRIAREAAGANGDETASRAQRGIGRPGVSEAVRARVAALGGGGPTGRPGGGGGRGG